VTAFFPWGLDGFSQLQTFFQEKKKPPLPGWKNNLIGKK
jgi:hypothetical protein